jgi:hypothetical protein
MGLTDEFIVPPDEFSYNTNLGKLQQLVKSFYSQVGKKLQVHCLEYAIKHATLEKIHPTLIRPPLVKRKISPDGK